MIGLYHERFEHPYLLLLIPVSALLMGLAGYSELGGNHTRAGFLALYSIGALIILAFGYVALYTVKFSTQGLQWWRMRGNETD